MLTFGHRQDISHKRFGCARSINESPFEVQFEHQYGPTQINPAVHLNFAVLRKIDCFFVFYVVVFAVVVVFC